MKLYQHEGMVEALEKYNAWRKRELELAKTTPKKKRRVELKKKRVVEGEKRIKWSKKHGHDTYFDCSGDRDVEEMVCDSGDGVNQNKGKGKGSGLGKGKPQGKGKCAACGSSTHRRSSHRDCLFHKIRAKKDDHSDGTAEELITDSESGEYITGGDSSESEEIDICTCGAEGRAHKRGCPLSYRNRLPGRTLFPPPNNPGGHADPSPLEPEHVSSPPESVKPAPSEDVKVGDVCIHSRSMGDFHVPCRGFAGRYQLYCSKGVLNTSFSCTELIPVSGCSPIPLDEWRKAPRISLRSVTNDSALHEYCNCCVPQTSESIVLSSASEEENEAPEMWVSNGAAYNLSCRDRDVVLSRRGWLTDKIICAAHRCSCFSFPPTWPACNPPHCRRCLRFRSTLGNLFKSYTSETATGVLCPQLVVRVVLSMCMTVCTRLCPKKLCD